MSGLSSIPNKLRSDDSDRYETIYESYNYLFNSFSGKTLIDIGCSNGYFISRFLNDGGVFGIGVDPNTEYIADFIKRDISDVDNNSNLFDVCFYLDLHYHNGINYFDWIKSNVMTLFISPSGSNRNFELEKDLESSFNNYKFVSSSGYANRNIYMVIVNEIN